MVDRDARLSHAAIRISITRRQNDQAIDHGTPAASQLAGRKLRGYVTFRTTVMSGVSTEPSFAVGAINGIRLLVRLSTSSEWLSP